MKIFVGCSSSNEIDKKYNEDCSILLDLLFQKNELVFGACNNGLMGLSYEAALRNNNNIIGICPEAYKDDLKSLSCNKEIIVSSVFDRTKMLIAESDVLLFLPGGIGTYFELFSSIESKRCHEFDKPIIIFNSNGFFDGFVSLMDNIYNEKFSKSSDRLNYVVVDNVQDVVNVISDYNRGLTLSKKN